MSNGKTQETLTGAAWRLTGPAAYVVQASGTDRHGHQGLRHRIETDRVMVLDALRGLLGIELAARLENGERVELPAERGAFRRVRRSSASIELYDIEGACCVELRCVRVHYMPASGGDGFVGDLSDEELTHSGARYWWSILAKRLDIPLEQER